MRSVTYSTLCFMFAVGLLSGCSGSDNVPITSSSGPPSGPTAATEDRRVPESDALTSQEAALISQAESEPVPAPRPDL